MEAQARTIPLPLTTHARERMSRRRIHESAVAAALEFGREIRARGAEFYVIGRRDIDRARRAGRDLRCLEGLQVVRGDQLRDLAQRHVGCVY